MSIFMWVEVGAFFVQAAMRTHAMYESRLFGVSQRIPSGARASYISDASYMAVLTSRVGGP